MCVSVGSGLRTVCGGGKKPLSRAVQTPVGPRKSFIPADVDIPVLFYMHV